VHCNWLQKWTSGEWQIHLPIHPSSCSSS
jgi:hypothetical protein